MMKKQAMKITKNDDTKQRMNNAKLLYTNINNNQLNINRVYDDEKSKTEKLHITKRKSFLGQKERSEELIDDSSN